MRFARTKIGPAIVFLVVFPLHVSIADDNAVTARVKILIEQLASKNEAPPIRGNARRGQDQTITFPKTYDRSLQVPVYLAVQALLGEDELSIDLLFAHKSDDRYSFSTNSYKDENRTVSRVCHWIAERKILCYEPEIHEITRSSSNYPHLDPYQGSDGDPWEKWWAKNKNRGLANIQVEAIDAEIKFFKELDPKTTLPWHADSPGLSPEKFNALRDDNVRRLKLFRQYIAGTRTPYRPRTLDDEHNSFFGLPWAGRQHNK